jgi:hypothetical protein
MGRIGFGVVSITPIGVLPTQSMARVQARPTMDPCTPVIIPKSERRGAGSDSLIGIVEGVSSPMLRVKVAIIAV